MYMILFERARMHIRLAFSMRNIKDQNIHGYEL